MIDKLDRSQGRSLFALDVDGYDVARPDYPDELYNVLDKVLKDADQHSDNAEILEIGPGNGLASRHLARFETSRLTLVEPDIRFQPMLEQLKSTAIVPVELVFETFEGFSVEPNSYDLVLAATCFHWLDSEIRLNKIASLLKPGGTLVLFWNVFGDANQPDPFHDATTHLFDDVPESPSHENNQLPFALDIKARIEEFNTSLCFAAPEVHTVRWSLELNTDQMLALYGTFSGVNSLASADREKLLAGLESVAKNQFGGKVIRNMTSIAYVARTLTS